MASALWHYRVAENLMKDADQMSVDIENREAPESLEEANAMNVRMAELGTTVVMAQVHAALADVAVKAEIWKSHMPEKVREAWTAELKDVIPSGE